MDIKEEKKAIRRRVAELKGAVSMEEKLRLSEIIMAKLEVLPDFIASNTVLLYYSLPDEVQTEAFLNIWCDRKRIVLPVVEGDDLILKIYRPSMVNVGYKQIMEPAGTEIVEPHEIELGVIPGVAFDLSNNRLGRGKGYYDRLLPHIKCKMVGLGFGFQIVDRIPMEPFVRPVELVLCDQ